MSDERKDGENSNNEPTEEGSTGPSMPFEIPGLSIDPQDFMRDPMSAVFRIMSDPGAIAAVEQFMQTPAAQAMLEQGMRDPMVQSMLAGNPLLGSALSQARAGVPSYPPAPPAAAPVEEDDEDEDIDEPRLPLLNSPHGGPAYPDEQVFEGLEVLLGALDVGLREELAQFAEKRLRHHLAEKDVQRLEERHPGRRPVDVMLSQGAFAGDFAWYAICEFEQRLGLAPLAPLAKHALGCVRFSCGYRVPSFLTQLVLALADAELLSTDDLRFATWALSAQPRDGVDGSFEMDQRHAGELLNALAGGELEARVLAIFVVAVLSWKELEPSLRRSLVAGLFETFGPSRLREMALVWSEWLGERSEIEAWRANQAPDELCIALVEGACAALGVDAVLHHAASWRCSPPAAAHEGMLRVLDVQWSDADKALRDAYLGRLFGEASVSLRKLAYRVAAAWEPHEVLAKAEEDTDPSIRAWASAERALVKY